jgi:hypothetical protein
MDRTAGGMTGCRMHDPRSKIQDSKDSIRVLFAGTSCETSCCVISTEGRNLSLMLSRFLSRFAPSK